MLYDSQHYISLIDKSIKNKGVTGTSEHTHLGKKVQESKGQTHTPLFLSFKTNV